MIQGLHHIGIAVRSIDDVLPRYVDQLGMTVDSVEEVPSEGVKVCVLLAGETRVELLEPTDPGSPVARFLDRRGPGVHHLAYRVEDAGAVVRVLRDAEVPLIEPAPRPGAHGCTVAFIHPGHLQGTLVELVEDAP